MKEKQILTAFSPWAEPVIRGLTEPPTPAEREPEQPSPDAEPLSSAR